MNEELDAVLESLKEDRTPVEEKPSEAVEVEQVETEKADESQADPENQEDTEKDDVPFPKKAVNAISRREKQIAKLRAEKAALEAEVSRYRQPQANPQQNQNVSGEPSEDDFDNYGDFLEAKILHKLKMEKAKEETSNIEQQTAQQRSVYEQQKETELMDKMQVHVSKIPDFKQVIELNADIADEFPEHIVQAFYEADDGALAFYNLAKEDKLEALLSMSPAKAIMEIAKAQLEPSLKRVSNAPNPIPASRGSMKTQKSKEDMDGEELLKHFNIKY
jgi:hypothetical protein